VFPKVTQGVSRLSRRKRRTLQTAGVLAAAFVLGGATLVFSNRGRTNRYMPGESNADITESLTRNLPTDAPAPRLTDVTTEAGLADFVTFAGRRTSQLPEDMGPGAAWGDYDNDGDDDLFLVSAGGPLSMPADRLAPSALFENLADGHFRRVAAFPEPRLIGLGAAWGDVDGDGWIDLVVTGYNTLLLYHNDHGRFLRDSRFVSRQGFWSGAAWGDYDNDGDLDLYVCGYVKYVESDADRAVASDQNGVAVPFTLNPASYAPQRNLLFRNDGSGTFTEVAVARGVANESGRSLSALWHDFDDDGWLDLYVANDISDNVLYHNVNGRFEDISQAARVGDYRGAMGLAAGDWNRDGDDDLFVTHWIAQENALYDSLLKDTGQLGFADIGDGTGLGQVALPMVGWGTAFVDLDADGWLDLVVANGSTFETADAPKTLKPQSPFLFWNRRGESFYELAPLAASLKTPHVARGLAVSDFDNDGDMDVLIVRLGEPVQLLRNDMQQGHWVEVVLRTRANRRAPTRPALGAQVVAEVQGNTLRRAVTGASYLSQSTTVLHFGLGDADAIDRLVVRWRGATLGTYTVLAAGRTWEIVEGDPVARAIVRQSPPHAPSVAETAPAKRELSARERQIAFWEKFRAGMQALKADRDCPKAITLLREALSYDPAHEDGLYYLGNCLAAQGDVAGALAQYEQITQRNAQSHRGFARWGTLRAITAGSAGDLTRAEQALDQAYRLNPEETGALLSLGEVALMRGRRAVAQQRLTSVCQTNARATGAFFLLGYLRWTQGDTAGARHHLQDARTSLGTEWKPSGSTAEGDVARKAHEETTPLSRFWERWDGGLAPERAYARLDAFLKGVPR
jgi:tetratricopeptide (TPR) repeat protein